MLLNTVIRFGWQFCGPSEIEQLDSEKSATRALDQVLRDPNGLRLEVAPEPEST